MVVAVFHQGLEPPGFTLISRILSKKGIRMTERRKEEWDGRSRRPRGEEGSRRRHLDGRFNANKFYNITSMQI